MRQKLSHISVEIDEGIYVEPTAMKVGAWLDIWLKEYTGNVKPATYSVYEEHVRVHIKPYVGEVRLTRLAPHMVQARYNSLLNDRHLSPKSVHNIHGAFHKAMEQAKVLGYLRTNPLDAVVIPRVEKKQISTVKIGRPTGCPGWSEGSGRWCGRNAASPERSPRPWP